MSKTNENFGLRDQGNGSSDDEVKQGFVRLVDFVSKKGRASYFSRRAVAHRAYKKQHSVFSKSDPVSQAENNKIQKPV